MSNNAQTKYGTVVIFGASSGIGLATAEYLADKRREIITVSRRESNIGKWIKTDLTNIADIDALIAAVQYDPNSHLTIIAGYKIPNNAVSGFHTMMLEVTVEF